MNNDCKEGIIGMNGVESQMALVNSKWSKIKSFATILAEYGNEMSNLQRRAIKEAMMGAYSDWDSENRKLSCMMAKYLCNLSNSYQTVYR